MGTAEVLSRLDERLKVDGVFDRDSGILEAIPAALCIYSAELSLVQFNRLALAVWPPCAPDGPAAHRAAVERAAAAMKQLLRTAIESGSPARNRELRLTNADGSRAILLADIQPILLPSGPIDGAIVSFRDVTAYVAVEEALARRAKEQSALYRLTDRLNRTASLADLYESALETIIDALYCDRAAILLFDDNGVIRFAAWHDLSDGYRAAVEGHCPWSPEEKAPQPICVPDVRTAELPPALREAILGEGIRAIAFIPLIANGTLIGKVMTYYEVPHRFSEEELFLAMTVAHQVAFGVARSRGQEKRLRALEQLRQNEERLRLATQSGKVGLWEWDVVRNRVTWTDSLYAIHGVEKETFRGDVESYSSLVHPDDRDRVSKAIAAALAGTDRYELEFRILKPDGQVSWVFTNAIVLREGEHALRMLGASFDITERKRMESQRDLLLAELSHRVKNTLATVIAIAQQSFLRAASPDEARKSFEARIRALAHTHGRLAEANWSGVTLQQLLHDETLPYRREDGGNVRTTGPSIMLNPKCAISLGMALHELTTNAAKYGALSAACGAVNVSWQLVADGRQLHLTWKESGGPLVRMPERSGFGRLLLERVFVSDVSGTVHLDFAPDGLLCEIVLPLAGDSKGSGQTDGLAAGFG